jgi:capsular exopolysaccharide synthesis family protein
MGRIHDALQRAEEQRAREGGPRGGAGSLEQVHDWPVPTPKRLRRRGVRAKSLLDIRRFRIVLTDSESAVSEQYRSLRARIQSIRRGRSVRSLVVTSAVPREGKTTTAVNLALCFGLELEQKTCLVDADLRTPAVHRALPELPEIGLSDLLEGHASLDDALVEIPDTRLSILPVRSLPEHPSELLASRRMGQMLEELHERFVTTVVDAPPVLVLPDATTLVDLCDGALLVVGSGGSSRDNVEAALERIDQDRLLGAVLNGVEEAPQSYGYEYGGRAA